MFHSKKTFILVFLYRPSIQLSHRSPTRVTSNGDTSNYATLRKPPISPKTSLNKQKVILNNNPMATSSFRLPPPLSSTTNNNNNNTNLNSSPNTIDTFSSSSSRTRSLENINSIENKLPSNSLQIDTNSSLTNGNSHKKTNLQSLGDANLSSSTESTNNLPFANENVGTIKQRSPHNNNNNNNNLYNSSLNPMKRSLPIQFFEQTNTHLLKPSYPMTTAIYDNNERYITTNLISPTKQLRKPTTLSPTHLNGRNSSTLKYQTNKNTK